VPSSERVLYTRLTRGEHNSSVQRIVVLAVLVAALMIAGAEPQPTGAAQTPLLRSLFGSTLVRAEVIVQEGDGVRDLRVDRGRIRALSPKQLRLTERDGTVVAIPVATTTSVTFAGAVSSYASLRRGMNVTAVRDDGQPALHVVQPAQSLPKTVDALLFASQMIRAEVILHAGAERDVRVDHGQIVALRPRVVRLKELDGRLVALPVARNAAITLDGRKAPWSWLRTGMSATILRDGEGDASIVQASAAGGRK
jgi:hypothetical protein